MKSQQKPHHLARWEQGLIQCKVCLAYWYEDDAIKQARADERAKIFLKLRNFALRYMELTKPIPKGYENLNVGYVMLRELEKLESRTQKPKSTNIYQFSR